jgi:lipopolysaccharide export system protein LptC
VQLERRAAQRNTVLNTETLEINVQAQTAQTVDAVQIVEGTSILTGRGLQADLIAARYQILADLKARYVPVPRTQRRPAPAGLPKPQPVAAASISSEN